MRHLFHDILDKQIIDRERRKIAKVDSIILTLGAGGAPRVTAIETGFVVVARRFGPRIERFVKGIMKRLGVRDGEPWRLPFERVVGIGVHVEVDLDASRSPVLAGERVVRDRIITKIPGA
jgi:hypothetical protein